MFTASLWDICANCSRNVSYPIQPATDKPARCCARLCLDDAPQPTLAPLRPAAGAGLGGLAGGLLYGSFGAAALFRAAALTLAAGWLAANAVLRVCGEGGAAHVAAPCRDGAAQRQASTEYGEDAVLLRA